MAGTYFPTKKGLDDEVQTGQPPSIESVDGADPTSNEAQDALDAAQPELAAFVAAQRHHVASSITDYHARSYSGQYADARYVNHRGQERITYYPKPQYAQPGGGEDQPQDQDEEQEQAQQERILNSPPTLYLMVLFYTLDKNGLPAGGIAALRMDDLVSGTVTADYVGIARESQWAPSEGSILTSLQLKIGGKKVILAPIDLTGKSSPKTYQLMTTAFTDVVATQGDLSSVPVMNASPNGMFWTMGGGFFYDPTRSKFVLTTSMATEGRVVEPCAIDTDGTCYYFPTITGLSALVLDAKSTSAAYPTCNSLSNDLQAKAKTLIQGQQVDTYSAGCFTYGETRQESDSRPAGHGPLVVTSTNTITQTVYAIGPVKQGPTVAAQAYYGSGKMGTLPLTAGLTIVVEETDIPSYDLGSNQSKPLTAGQTGISTMASNLPLMTYPGSTGGGDIEFHLFDMNGFCTAKSKMQLDTSVPGNIIAGGGAAYTNTGRDPSSADWDEILITMDALYQYNSAITYPDLPSDHPYSLPSVAETYADMLRDLTINQPGITGSRDIPCTPLVTQTTTTADSATGTVSGDASSPDNFPVPSDHLIGAVGGATYFSEAFIYLNHPYSLFYNIVATSQSSAAIFGDTNLNNSDANTPPNYSTFKVHAFPPCIGVGSSAKGWYTNIEYEFGIESVTVQTPYGKHQYQGQSNEEIFTPWLHVSNGSHFLQGYYISTSPYVYLDGKDSTNLIDAIASACKCKPTDVVTMFMDIDINTIRQIAKVQPVSYSASAKGDPGPPPGKASAPSGA